MIFEVMNIKGIKVTDFYFSFGNNLTVFIISLHSVIIFLSYTDKNAFSVAFVPGGLGGKFDTTYLFDDFLAMVRGNRKEG